MVGPAITVAASITRKPCSGMGGMGLAEVMTGARARPVQRRERLVQDALSAVALIMPYRCL
jgi:hypothetical protein